MPKTKGRWLTSHRFVPRLFDFIRCLWLKYLLRFEFFVDISDCPIFSQWSLKKRERNTVSKWPLSMGGGCSDLQYGGGGPSTQPLLDRYIIPHTTIKNRVKHTFSSVRHLALISHFRFRSQHLDRAFRCQWLFVKGGNSVFLLKIWDEIVYWKCHWIHSYQYIHPSIIPSVLGEGKSLLGEAVDKS